MLKIYGLDYGIENGKYSMILFTNGCNLKCYRCYNRKLAGWDYDSNGKIINVMNSYRQLDNNEIRMGLENVNIVERVIICGGESLIYSTNDILDTIDFIKSINSKILIRIDTNGINSEKVKILKNSKLIDGFGIDIKYPYWSDKYQDLIEKIMGISYEYTKQIFPRIIESLELVKDMSETIYRTLRYPFIVDLNYYEIIKNYVASNLNNKSYNINPYFNI